MEEPRNLYDDDKMSNERVIKNSANWFFWIAGLSFANSIFFYTGGSITFIIGLFITQLVASIGYDIYPLIIDIPWFYLLNFLIIASTACLGLFAKKGITWAFLIGIVIYTLDGLLALLYGDFFGAGFHIVALFYLYTGYQVSKVLEDKETLHNNENLAVLILGFFLIFSVLSGFYVWVNPNNVYEKLKFYTIENENELSIFISNYYFLKENTELTPEAIKFIGAHNYVEDEMTSRVLTVFFSCVFSANEDKRDEWNNIIIMQDTKTRLFFIEAMNKDVSELLRETETSPLLNDMYWHAFFATGDIKYINKLIDNLEYLNERRDLNLFYTAWSAKWSLATNIQFYPEVRYLVEELSQNTADLELRNVASDILNETPWEITQEINMIYEEQHKKGVW